MRIPLSILPIAFALLVCTLVVEAKVFRKCEVVKKLEASNVSRTYIPTFVCLAGSESRMNSSYTVENSRSTKYGIFQLDNKTWCRDGRSGGLCNVKCEDLIKDDIRPSIACAIIREHKSGFRDWPTFDKNCLPNKVPNIQDCRN